MKFLLVSETIQVTSDEKKNYTLLLWNTLYVQQYKIRSFQLSNISWTTFPLKAKLSYFLSKKSAQNQYKIHYNTTTSMLGD